MLILIAIILLAAYSVVTVASFLIVRQGWMRAYPAFVVSFVLNSMIVFAFSLIRGNGLLQAVIVGPTTALVFSGLCVTFATMFRAVPLPKPALNLKPVLETADQIAS